MANVIKILQMKELYVELLDTKHTVEDIDIFSKNTIEIFKVLTEVRKKEIEGEKNE